MKATSVIQPRNETLYTSKIAHAVSNYLKAPNLNYDQPHSTQQNTLKKCFDLIIELDSWVVLLLEVKLCESWLEIPSFKPSQHQILIELFAANIPIQYCYNLTHFSSLTKLEEIMDSSETCEPTQFQVESKILTRSPHAISLKQLVDKLRCSGASPVVHFFTDPSTIGELGKITNDFLLFLYNAEKDELLLFDFEGLKRMAEYFAERLPTTKLATKKLETMKAPEIRDIVRKRTELVMSEARNRFPAKMTVLSEPAYNPSLDDDSGISLRM